MSITLNPVQSSQIAATGYDAASKTLAIKFNNGQKVYHYHDVPQEEFHALMAADSIGKHFGANIRGKFEHTLQDEVQHGEAEKV